MSTTGAECVFGALALESEPVDPRLQACGAGTGRLEASPMKYYDESQTSALREALETVILRWPLVTTRKMFGCPCYKAKDKMFVFLVTRGIVFLSLSAGDRETLARDFAGVPFDTGTGRQMKGWVQVAVDDPAGLEPLWPFVERSYRGAIEKADAEE